jgi:hypothetical protein
LRSIFATYFPISSWLGCSLEPLLIFRLPFYPKASFIELGTLNLAFAAPFLDCYDEVSESSLAAWLNNFSCLA